MADLELESRAVIDQYVVRRLVYLIPVEPRDNPDWVSSGTIFGTPKGHVVVLTARHCAKDAADREVRVGFHECAQVIHNSVAGVTYYPDRNVDAALLVMKGAAREALRAFAMGPNDIAEDEIVPATDLVFLGGFPSGLVIRRGARDWGLKSVNYGTALADPPLDRGGRYRVLWTEMVTADGNIEMPDPEGISGGALWRFRGGVSTVWSPTNRIRLAGIPIAWRDAERVEVAEPSSRWKAWVVAAFDEVDRTMPIE